MGDFKNIFIKGKYDEVMLKTAELWAQQSTCSKRQVGAVIAKDDRIISIGYNGTISGSYNNCEKYSFKCLSCKSDIDASELFDVNNTDKKRFVKCKCGATYEYPIDYLEEHEQDFIVTKEEVLHAEQNALMFATKNGITTNEATMYVTCAPCVTCSKLIVQSGITKVIYREDYKDTKGIELLSKYITVFKLP